MNSTEEQRFQSRIYDAVLGAYGAYQTMLSKIPHNEIPGIPDMLKDAEDLILKMNAMKWDDIHVWMDEWNSSRYGSLKQTVIKLEEKMRIDMRKANGE